MVASCPLALKLAQKIINLLLATLEFILGVQELFLQFRIFLFGCDASEGL